MPVLAGDIVSAATLNNLQSKSYHADSSATIGPSVTDTDIPGATITLTTLTNNAVYVVNADFDFDYGGAGIAVELGKLDIDGLIQPGFAICQDGSATANDRRTHSRTWRGVLATAGSHTLKLKGTVGVVCTVGGPHTEINVTITEVV